METNTYQKFNKCIEKVFESTEDGETSLDFGKYYSGLIYKMQILNSYLLLFFFFKMKMILYHQNL